MNKWICLIVAAAFLGGALISIAVEQCPDVVKIENKYPRRLKTPVTLDHKKHVVANKIVCTECHHTWKEKERKTPQKCAECHKAKEKGKLGLKRAYHKQCYLDCHKNSKKAGKKAGPTLCSGCHPKKK